MNKHFNFLFVTKNDDEESARIVGEIERNKLYKVQTVETSEKCMERLGQGSLHCIIFNFQDFTAPRFKLISNVRDAGFPYPVIVFSKTTARPVLDLVQKLPKIVIIEKPFESKDVWGICQKMIQGQRVAQRIFRRYNTSQTAHIERTATGETLDAHIFNLSRGGAYVELGSGRVTPGDLLKVAIPLDKIAKNYNVDAEVVWYTPRGYAKGWPAAGVRFIKPGEVYRNLLNKL